MTLVRHGMMLVGPTGGGKTRCYKILKSAFNKLHTDEMYEKCKTMILNPKSITKGQMCGQFDGVTHEWSDGTLANQTRLFVQDDTPDRCAQPATGIRGEPAIVSWRSGPRVPARPPGAVKHSSCSPR